ncbi:extracellular catalytic domain type 2 short-chain-length polyhydroxyalkanoate depolymerase [Aliidiomarina sp. Khilg15.8]
MRKAYLAGVVVLAAACSDEPPRELESGLNVLNVDPFSLTVSGISSGGYMAHQFHLAYGDRVHGAAMLASGPYDCARGSLGIALTECMGTPERKPDATALLQRALERVKARDLAPLSTVYRDRVWLFRGSQDTTIGKPVFDGLVDFYNQVTMTQNIEVVTDIDAAHVFPTEDFGVVCDTSESPYLGQCDFDASGALLRHLYGELHDVDPKTGGTLTSFDQHEAAGSYADTLAETGYLYIPDECRDGAACSIHISFHGCNQQAEAVGEAYVRNSGLNRWADTNRLVILYPQVTASKVLPMNPQACWDWWGYSGTEYATIDGQQIQAVIRMVNKIAGVQMAD